MISLPADRSSLLHGLAALALALGCIMPLMPSLPARAAAPASYQALTDQLTALVARRGAALAALNRVDETLGAALARDVLTVIQPDLAEQSRLLGRMADDLDPHAAANVAQASDRSQAPGVLLGSHLPVALASNGAGNDLGADSAHQPLAALLAAPSLQVHPGRSSASEGLLLNAAQALIANVQPAPASVPVDYADLGTADGIDATRSIEASGLTWPLPGMAPQVRLDGMPAPVPAVQAPPALVPTQGVLPLALLGSAGSTLLESVGGAPQPEAVSSLGVLATQPITSMAVLDASLGQYHLALGTAAPVVSPGGSFWPAAEPASTWAFTATSILTSSSTLLSVGNATADGGMLRNASYDFYSLATVWTAPSATPAITLTLSPDGAGRLTAVTPISGTAVLTATASVAGVAEDPQVAAGLRQEAGLRSQLAAILDRGNMVYAALKPFYDARLTAYNSQLSAIISHNSLLEQAWWNRTHVWTQYQATLKQWQARHQAWASFVQRGQAPAATGTPASGTGTIPARVAPLSGPAATRAESTAAPVPPSPAVLSTPVSLTGEVSATPVAVPSAMDTAARSPRVPLPKTSAFLASLDGGGVAAMRPALPHGASTNAVNSARLALLAQIAGPSPTAVAGWVTPVSAPQGTATSLGLLPSMITATPASTSPTWAAAVSPTAMVVASPSPAFTPTVSDTVTPSVSDSAVPVSPTSTVPSATPTESTATSTATTTFAPPTASATTAPPTATPMLTALPTRTPPVPRPGPPPAAVAPPGPEPVTLALPSVLPPLPGWVTEPPTFSTGPAEFMLDNQLASAGYGRFTQQQLVDAGVLENVTGYEPPIHGVITTLFGGSTPFQAFHTGLDIAGPDGTPVHAAAGGLVIYAGLAVPGQPTMSYGNCVVIMHNAHTVTIYGHMQLGLHDLQVRVGEVVSQGQVIGFEGATGWATGPHVHFEMRINNVAFDPLLLLNVTEVTAP